MWGAIIAAGLAIASTIIANKQDKKRASEQHKATKDLAKQNQQIALQNWDKTNYSAQMEQIKKAGLSPGLIYGQGGSQGGIGATAGGGSASKAETKTPDINGAIGMGLQTQLMKAQKDNIEANTEKTKVETAKTAGVDTQEKTGAIAKLAQDTANAELQGQIMEYDKQIKSIQANKDNLTQEEYIKQMKIATDKLTSEAQSAKAKGNVDEKSQQNVIEAIRLANEETKTGITNTQATTEQTKQNTANLKQSEIEKTLDNELKKNGVQPTDSPALRIVTRVINNAGTSLEKMQKKMGAIIAWLKGQNGNQTKERFEEIWNE